MSLLTTCQIFTDCSLVKNPSIITMLATKLTEMRLPLLCPGDKTQPTLQHDFNACRTHTSKHPGLAFRNIFKTYLQKEADAIKMKLCKNMNSILLRFFSSCVHSRVRDKLPGTAIMIKIKRLPLKMKICAAQGYKLLNYSSRPMGMHLQST